MQCYTVQWLLATFCFAGGVFTVFLETSQMIDAFLLAAQQKHCDLRDNFQEGCYTTVPMQFFKSVFQCCVVLRKVYTT